RALSTSTLMKKLNTGDVKGAADEFLRWNRSGGKVMAGLTNRRKAEREVFLS
ncbi:TPA: lysozyme, partial [Klebsiella variicola]|nr:lysozyme [Klebsiella variicola]HBX9956492.1 lysozyme [Klebsiella variicola]